MTTEATTFKLHHLERIKNYLTEHPNYYFRKVDDNEYKNSTASINNADVGDVSFLIKIDKPNDKVTIIFSFVDGCYDETLVRCVEQFIKHLK